VGRRYLVTGGAGFIGSNFIRYLSRHEPGAQVTNLDLLTYAGVEATARELDALPGHQLVRGDICDADLVEKVVIDHDVVVHFAAESHVDRSIEGPAVFLETNVLGTGTLLEAAHRQRVKRFIHVSTDEVYGSVSGQPAGEDAPLRPSSPYSASKAGADMVALAFATTYDCPVIVTRCGNNYGPYQHPEKLIPRFVTNLLDDRRVPLFGTGEHERDWLFVEDHCAAIHLLIDDGVPGEIYNIGAGDQRSNIEVTRRILRSLGRDESWIDYVPDRLGHDLKYAVDSSKLRGLGWVPAHDFDDRLEETVDWYRARQDWWRPIKLEVP
jgi:dTDP-glucose 4,6-dehydratase